MLLDRRAGGTAILLVSEELDEILTPVPTASLVMYEGRIAAVVEPATADIHDIGMLMTGGAAMSDPPRAARGHPALALAAAHDRSPWSSRSLIGAVILAVRRGRPDPVLPAHPRGRVRERRRLSATPW